MADFLSNLMNDPNFQAGLNQLATPRMTLTQAQINNSAADSQYKQQKAKQEFLSGQKLQEYLTTGNPQSAQEYLMLGGNPNMIQASQLLQQQQQQQGASQSYQQQYPQPGQFGGLGMPPPMQPAPMQGAPIPSPAPPPLPPTAPPPAQQMPQPPMTPPPQVQPPQASIAPELPPNVQVAADRLRAANQKLAAAGATQNPGIVAAAQAEREQAKVDYDREMDMFKQNREKDLEAQKPLTKEESQTLDLAKDGLRSVDEIEKLIFDEKGNLRPDYVITAAQQSHIPFTNVDLAFTPDARNLSTSGYGAVSNLLYLKSGAQASKEEVINNMGAYMPGVRDNDATAKFKLQQLRNFFTDKLSSVRGNPTASKTVTAAPEKKAAPPVPPALQAKGITSEKWAEFLKEKEGK